MEAADPLQVARSAAANVRNDIEQKKSEVSNSLASTIATKSRINTEIAALKAALATQEAALRGIEQTQADQEATHAKLHAQSEEINAFLNSSLFAEPNE